MLKILQFIFQDIWHYTGTIILIIIIGAVIRDIGKAFVRDYCPKTYIVPKEYLDDNLNSAEKNDLDKEDKS